MRFIRRNAIALAALVCAMTGTGIAASRYIITSPSQIKPSVLQKLRGEADAAAAAAAIRGPKAVVARIRIAQPYTTSLTEEPIPLEGGTWTQSAGQLDHVELNLKVTAGSVGCSGGIGIKLDGAGLAQGFVSLSAGETTLFAPNNWGGKEGAWLVEPQANTSHTITVVAYNNTCSGGHLTVSGAIYVIGFR